MVLQMDVATANRLYEYRKKNGLSQEELAEKLGVSRQAVSKWERAEASPDTDNLINLSKIYGVSLDALINKSPNNCETGDTAGAESDSEGDKNDSDDGKSSDKNNSATNISFNNGIHIEDGDEKVHISSKGIHVEDSNETVNIGWHGINIDKDKVNENLDDKYKSKDGSFKFKYANGKAYVNGVEVDEEDYDKMENMNIHIRSCRNKRMVLRDFPFALLATISYLLLGFIGGYWHPGWIVFMLIPVVHSAIEAIEKRNLSCFAYPVFISALYVFLGCVYSLWNPYWVLFLTIPFFYWIANSIKK